MNVANLQLEGLLMAIGLINHIRGREAFRAARSMRAISTNTSQGEEIAVAYDSPGYPHRRRPGRFWLDWQL